MNTKAKIIVSALFVILALGMLFVFSKSDHYTVDELKQAIEKAETISLDFSNVTLYKETENVYLKEDVITGKNIKIVEIRINPNNVLNVGYNDNNVMIYGEVMPKLEMIRAISFIIVVVMFIVSFCTLWISIFNTLIEKKRLTSYKKICEPKKDIVEHTND